MTRLEHRNISAIGSSIIYNSKVLSKYTHLLYNFHPTDADCDAMNKRAMDFVRSFDGGRYLVKKKRFFIPHSLGGMNLRNFGFFSKSLLSHWLKQLQRDDASTNQDWSSVLRFLLSKLKLRIEDIQSLGYNDLKKIGEKLLPDSNFWSKTFVTLSSLVKDVEIKHKDFTTLPILGGTLAKQLKRPELSIFSPTLGKNFIRMIRHGYSRIQDFAKFNTGINENLLNCTKLILHNDLPQTLTKGPSN